MFSDIEFLKAIWVSSTFRESLLSAGLFFAFLILLVYLVLRALMKENLVAGVRRCFCLNKDSRGSANAADFVLIMPFFMFIMCLFVQMAMVVNTSLIVHYAAYSAARAARVHFCNRSVLEYTLGYLNCSVERAERAALKAARYTLIAASPVDDSIQSNGNPPNQSLQLLADEYLERKSPILIQARYAYDDRNVIVEVEPATSSDTFIEAQYYAERVSSYDSGSDIDTWTDRKLLNAWPVTVSVEYVKHLGVPLVGPFLSNVSRGNDHFRTIEAEITLL